MACKRLLLIDDDEDILDVASLTLETMGDYKVSTASSGRAGIAYALEHRPDAILLDVMMPELDGPSTFRELLAHAATRTIPVIFLTAKVQSADRRRLKDLGATGIIAKPFDPMALAAEVRNILDGKPAQTRPEVFPAQP
jgi:DNA-binding response OmpR family regulator